MTPFRGHLFDDTPVIVLDTDPAGPDWLVITPDREVVWRGGPVYFDKHFKTDPPHPDDISEWLDR